ncbi:MAG: CHRD domain-containing protein, partial [Chitinophagales bacterium]|nr:CHRD domain-containing protein [Chitinophagales bacterium]
MKKLFTYSLILLASFQIAKADHLSGNLTLSAKLDGAQETPSVVTNALGVSSFVLNSTRDTLCIHASVNGLSGAITGAHIHSGAAGTSGGVVVDLTSFVSGNDINASITGSALTSDLISSMLSGGNYLNVHTAANPDGEIRGQIYLETDYQYTAMLDGSQEVPAVVTSAYGLGSFNLYKNQKAITINVVVQGLSGAITGAHFHVGAPGVSGGVVEDLTSMVTGNVIVGEVDPALYLSDLLAGNIYINIHTTANPNGEIRGQVITDTKLAFDATIDGIQEVPAVVTSALGVAVAKLNTAMDTMWYHVVADGLSGAITGAHFHSGKKGVSGGVVVDLSAGISGNQVDGMISGSALTSDLINSFLTGGIYVNLHTATNPNGEIRGQVYRYAREGYTFTMDGGQEVPSTNATATGSGIISIDRDQENAHIMIVLSG